MKTKKIIFIAILLLLIAFWGWYFFIRIDRDKAITIIIKNTNSGLTESDFTGFGSDYLIARAKAFRSKSGTFELDGKIYKTDTGKSI